MPPSACTERRRPSKVKGRVTTPMVERPDRPGHVGHHGGGAGAGAATFPRRDEHHVGALERLFDLTPVLLGRLSADLGVAPRPRARG